MKQVKKIFHAERDDIADLITFRALPVPGLEDLNPFLLLNHHGPQTYVENNHGLPFGPHPHRGFETVTFIIEGDIAHRDSTGSESVIMAGGIQWMTAGKGIIHSEVSSEHFKRAGGALEILQLWVNLPARLKMSDPWYLGLQKNQIPHYERDAGKVNVQLVSGKWEDNLGPIPTLRPATTMLVALKDDAFYEFELPPDEVVFFYVVTGFVTVNGAKAGPRETVTFEEAGTHIKVSTDKGARVLLCHAPPLDEPIVSYGPFVMNSMEEIQEAIRDYQQGKFQ